MKAAILLRVSKDDGTQDTENQLHDCQEMAKQRGYDVPPEFVFREEVSGGKLRGERPVLDAVAGLAARGKFSVLIVWRLDRFSRDDSFLGGLMQMGEFCEQYKVPVLSYSETYLDTTGPFRQPLTTLAMTLHAEVRKGIVIHTRKALDKRKREIATSGRFLVTGDKSKRKGQFATYLGRPKLSEEKERAIRVQWVAGLNAYRASKALGYPESTIRTAYRRFEGQACAQKGGESAGGQVAKNLGNGEPPK